jgi:hypothetical protein
MHDGGGAVEDDLGAFGQDDEGLSDENKRFEKKLEILIN